MLFCENCLLLLPIFEFSRRFLRFVKIIHILHISAPPNRNFQAMNKNKRRQGKLPEYIYIIAPSKIILVSCA